MPGYGFSEPPKVPGYGASKFGDIFNELMKLIGYNEYCKFFCFDFIFCFLHDEEKKDDRIKQGCDK